MQLQKMNGTLQTDDYPEENMEDETSDTAFGQVSDMKERGMAGFGSPAQIGAADLANMLTTEKPVSLSSDSLAFTLVYCSVFTVTILYIGYKLSKRWRKDRIRQEQGGEEFNSSAESPARRCNHAVCQQAHERNGILPYSGLGAMWIPEMRTVGGTGGLAVHHSGHCNNSCENCIKLSQPPPSYAKLFLDESPPTYSDALTMETDVDAQYCPAYEQHAQVNGQDAQVDGQDAQVDGQSAQNVSTSGLRDSSSLDASTVSDPNTDQTLIVQIGQSNENTYLSRTSLGCSHIHDLSFLDNTV